MPDFDDEMDEPDCQSSLYSSPSSCSVLSHPIDGPEDAAASDSRESHAGTNSYPAPKFGDFGLYMQQKRRKLMAQDSEMPLTSVGLPIFKGLSIYINGYVEEVSQLDLKHLILRHGGQYSQHLSKTHTTHVVASNLTESKKFQLRRLKVAAPRWILDSVSQGRLLPWHNYSVFEAPSNTLASMLGPSNPFPAPTAEPGNKQQDHLRQINDVSPPNTSCLFPSSSTRRVVDSSKPEQFLTSYYQNSRLHFLSTWKSWLQNLVRPFQESIQANPPPSHQHCILFHVDMDSYFVSVTLRNRPVLRDLPVAVAHSSSLRDKSYGELASCNYIARQFGVHNGMYLTKAKELCPQLVLVPYQFEDYWSTTKCIYEVLMRYADNIHAISCDEAFVDVSSKINVPVMPAQILEFANLIRSEIASITDGCTASVGAGENMLLARLATRKAKPDGAYYWKRQEFLMQRHTIKSSDIPGVGGKTARRLDELGIRTCLDMVNFGKLNLQKELGKHTGQTLYDACHGIDERGFGHKERQTVSAEVNYGIRFKSRAEADVFISKLSEEVSRRLHQEHVQTSQLTLKLMVRAPHAPVEPLKYLGHGVCTNHSKSVSLKSPTNEPGVIASETCKLLDTFPFEPSDLRGVGVSCTRLGHVNAPAILGGEKRKRQQADLREYLKNRTTARPSDDADFNPVECRSDDVCDIRVPPKITYPNPTPVLPETVDWAVFNSLPPAIQSEIRGAWDVQQCARQSSKYPGPVATCGPIPSLLKGKRKAIPNRPAPIKPITITDVEVEAALQAEDGIDLSVLNALPNDVRAEIVTEKRSKLHFMRIKSKCPPLEHKGKDQNMATTVPPCTLAVPTFMECTELGEIRPLLKEWLKHTAHEFENVDIETDAAYLNEYISALVRAQYIDRVHAILQYLIYLATHRMSDLVPGVAPNEASCQGPQTRQRQAMDVITELVNHIICTTRAYFRDMHQMELDISKW